MIDFLLSSDCRILLSRWAVANSSVKRLKTVKEFKKKKQRQQRKEALTVSGTRTVLNVRPFGSARQDTLSGYRPLAVVNAPGGHLAAEKWTIIHSAPSSDSLSNLCWFACSALAPCWCLSGLSSLGSFNGFRTVIMMLMSRHDFTMNW